MSSAAKPRRGGGATPGSGGQQLLGGVSKRRGARARARSAGRMRFCPWDGSLLIVDNAGTDGHFRFRCVACPYVDRIRPDRPVQVRERKAAKKADDVLGGEEAWKDVSTTEASCPKCGNKRAYYIEFQTRSADEPATIFMKCTACSQQWKE